MCAVCTFCKNVHNCDRPLNLYYREAKDDLGAADIEGGVQPARPRPMFGCRSRQSRPVADPQPHRSSPNTHVTQW